MPTKMSGNLVGRMIASLSEFLANSRPATSSHLTLGFSETIALEIAALYFSASGSFASGG